MSVFFRRRGKAAELVNYVEYLESNAAQYINTKFTPNQDTRVVIDFELLALNNQYAVPIFGTRTSASSKAYYLWAVGTNTAAEQYQSGYNNGSTYPAVTRIGRHKVDKNKNVTTVDGVTTTATYASFTAEWPILLFNSYNNGSLYGSNVKVRIYSCQIYDNGTLVRDYRPCYDPDGVACMYDRVNKEYTYNAGSGNFVAEGTEIIYQWQKYTVAQVYANKLYNSSGWKQANATEVGWSSSIPGTATYPADQSSKFGFRYSGSYEAWEVNYKSSYPYIGILDYRPGIGYVTESDTVYYVSSANSSGFNYYYYYKREQTNQRGSYIEDVTSTDENAYPTNGVQGGYWYVKIS